MTDNKHPSDPLQEMPDALIQKLKEYIEFLGQHTAADAGFKAIHGIRISPEEFEKGVKFRAEIEQLEAAYLRSHQPISQPTQ